tara:strand:- start:196 stop:645 length:450 start_codon:yes stop_codon:yes gene_type:complete
MYKFIIIFFIFISACSNNKVVNSHGLKELSKKYNKIEISKSNKNDVINIIGKPSSISLFDENLWFFIERENVNQSVFKLGKSKIQKNDVIEIVFNDYGIVKTKKIYDLNDMNDLKIIKETTNKSYGSNSPIGKFLKSMEQKLNSPKSRR